MNEKKLTVTIGIPAYNEEANIGRLLQTVLEQEETNFILKKIIVVSDNSDDGTDAIVKATHDKRMVLFRNKKRKGQIYAQNKIFAFAKTDIVVLLEADTYPQSTGYLHELIQPIIHNAKVGLVHGNVRPFPAASLVGKILEQQVNSSYHFMIQAKDLDEWFSSGRGGRAFSKKIYTRLVWPPAVPEDVYAMIWCKKERIECVFQKTATCRYKIPQSFVDLLRERQKTQYFQNQYLSF